ncbi:MAG: UDP-3-O-acyl-N-acetylglucosamine deacetylase [Pelagibacteraceae bacterium]|jgi:UDP-3-O-[3-hydroxymyristoyl] N-acetylglucosamine deacetylase|nr:UDP-3-O-acyl-N-acetylglucosamine deacetylase [Pelagibacteraceae bacterium]MBT6355244.1 UDP-3-O-acyl-N-acetylglucosamine deacetylase [Pelagibacteraceae bacterium]
MIDINPNNSNQQTIKNEILLAGIGLHSGKQVELQLKPAEIDNGIKFIRTDKIKDNVINAVWSNVTETVLSTTISNKGGLKISTIEHLMSALSGLHIDNLNIYINAPEVPIMDGSSRPFVDAIEDTGIKIQSKKRKILNVKKVIEVKNNDSSVKIIPNKQFSIDFEIDFPSQLVSKQSCQLQLINGNYKADIAAARTFGFEKDVEHLRSNGLALGGSLDNAVVVGERKILNKDGLRYNDEFVRHKILDSIGDLYLAGSPIIGYFYGNKSGHYLNNQLLRKLFSDESNYEYIV